MRTTERDAKAAPLLKARIAAASVFEPLTTGDEYGTDWEIVSVDDHGRVLTSQRMTVDGEESAATVMDELDSGWDER